MVLVVAQHHLAKLRAVEVLAAHSETDTHQTNTAAEQGGAAQAERERWVRVAAVRAVLATVTTLAALVVLLIATAPVSAGQSSTVSPTFCWLTV